jgi:hypothetical protein
LIDGYLIGSATSVFSISRLRIRVWPFLATIGLGLLVLFPAGIVNGWVTKHMGMERNMAMPWLAHYMDHAAMLVVALGLNICANQAKRGLWPLCL